MTETKTVEVTQADRELAEFIVSQTRGFGVKLPKDWDSRVQAAARHRLASQSRSSDIEAERDRLREAARQLLARMSSTYHARNGRQMGIEADDGEKCWIVHSDEISVLEAALAEVIDA